MIVKTYKIRLTLILLTCFLISAVILSFAETQTNFSETISVLKASYNGEMQAEQRYHAYARKANEEGYPNIAYFFLNWRPLNQYMPATSNSSCPSWESK